MSDSDDEKNFQEAMSDVRPLTGKNISKSHPGQSRRTNADIPESTLKARRKAAQDERPASGAALSEGWIEPIDPEQSIAFSRPGIQQTRLRQLRQGTLSVQFQLDLHGYKIDEARELIHEFIQVSRLRGLTCVRIIHGKSHRSKERQTTLKSHTNHWLKQMPEILAFCSAPASQGGTGSVLVLLKRK